MRNSLRRSRVSQIRAVTSQKKCKNVAKQFCRKIVAHNLLKSAHNLHKPQGEACEGYEHPLLRYSFARFRERSYQYCKDVKIWHYLLQIFRIYQTNIVYHDFWWYQWWWGGGGTRRQWWWWCTDVGHVCCAMQCTDSCHCNGDETRSWATQLATIKETTDSTRNDYSFKNSTQSDLVRWASQMGRLHSKHLRVLKLSTVVDTRIFSHIYLNIFRIPEFSSGFLKFCSGLFA